MRQITTFRFCVSSILLVVLAGCETLIPSHPRSYKIENEKVLVEVLPPQTAKPKNDKGVQEALPAAAAILVPLVADFAIKKTAAALEEESKKYTGTYSGSKPESKFYADAGPVPSLEFGGLKITRMVDVNGKSTPAAVYTFAVDGAEVPVNGQLQLVGESAQVTYAKAKVADWRWYMPWTWLKKTKEAIDIDINVTIEAHWVDEKESAHRDDVADLNMAIRGLKLGETLYISDVRSEWFPLLPRTKKLNPGKAASLGTGTFVIKAKVTEYDDYGKRVKDLSEYISSNRSDWVQKVKSAVSGNAK